MLNKISKNFSISLLSTLTLTVISLSQIPKQTGLNIESPSPVLAITPQEENRLLPVNGQSLTASLQRGDTTLPNNTYAHVYAFEGKAGQTITIEMKSQQLDPSLLLYLPDQDKLIGQNDDISMNDFNARLEVTLPEDGIYLLFANAFEQGETGEYQLKASWR